MALYQVFKLVKGTDLASFERGRESWMTSPGIWKGIVVVYLNVLQLAWKHRGKI
jgi:hypothetical protein